MLYLFMNTKKTSKPASPGRVFALIVLAIIIGSLGYGWHRRVSAQSGDKLDLQPEIVTITQFPLPNPSPAAQPFGILKYTDHAMWFTEKATGKLGRIAQDGTLTEYALPNANSQPTALVIASDFHIWFTETNTNKIGRINPVNVLSTGAITPGDGGNFTEFSVPTPNSQPFAIAIGQGGMFFTEANANKLGLIKYPLNSSNPTFVEFDVPTSSTLGAIVADFGGSDMSGFGRIWFTETSANKIGYFKEATGPPDFIVCEDKSSDYSQAKCFGEFPVTTAASGPFGIALGPDENIWFTEKDAGKIGRVDAAGVITEFTPSTANTIPLGIVSGPDGTLWFTESNANNIGQITTTGTITERNIPTANTQPQMIACDCKLSSSDSATRTLWFTENAGNAIGKVDPFASSTPTPTPTATPTPTPTATPTPTPTPTPASSVQFSSSTYAVNEDGGKVDVTVTRSGNTSGTASVNYATSDTAGVVNCNVANGVASAKCDYISGFGTLKFAAGETSKTISILIINDGYVEGSETFSITLSNAAGVSLGSQATATVTINDNDPSTGANPVDQPGFFVTEHYYDFLNRTPDTDGLAFWTNEITSCGTDQTCIGLKRINVSAAYFLSIEFQQTGYLVERMYKTAFGSASGTSTLGGTHQVAVPVVRFNEFLADTQQIGQGVVVNVGNWQQQLESNKQAFASEFVQRSRFTSAFATTLTPAQFVDQLFTNAGVTPAASDRNAAIAEFGSATNTSDAAARGRALRDVAENSILNTTEFNRAFVLMQFFGYLRRNPNDPQDIDYTGYEFWLNKLNQFNGNFVAAEMVKAFITSTEYRQRFGP